MIIIRRKDLIRGLVILIAVIVGLGVSSIFFNGFNVQNDCTSGGCYFSDVQAEPAEASYIILGATNIQVPPEAVVVTQVDRVIRDIESNYNLDISADNQPTSPDELVPWMEGELTGYLMEYANVRVVPATDVTVKKINNSYYGPDDQGNFKFLLDPGKMHPSRVTQIDSETYNAIDTHGMNFVVADAVENNAFLAIACGDTPGKAEAQEYMASKGINSYSPCDRYTPLLLNNKQPGTILGTMPIRPLNDENGAIIGGQPIQISLDEKIIAQNTDRGYPAQYCDTPERYFTSLESVYEVNLDLEIVDANVGETNKIVDQARASGANVIAVRVQDKSDRVPVEEWLKENPNNRALLFHSAIYKQGNELFYQFPNQVTGQDTEPVFIKDISLNEIENRFEEIRSLWG